MQDVLYRTIVVDPPWPYPEGWPRMPHGETARGRAKMPGLGRKPLPFSSMTVEEIAGLPISALADHSGCHLYLWTTNRYLPHAFQILKAWKFRYGQTLVWAKTPMGKGLGGTWAQSTEYVLVGRLGSLPPARRLDSTWFNWPRTGRQNTHSQKPEAFIDMVEQVSSPPYVELFARRHRLGWDVWGDETLNQHTRTLAEIRNMLHRHISDTV